jgi:hypothetical protein
MGAAKLDLFQSLFNRIEFYQAVGEHSRRMEGIFFRSVMNGKVPHVMCLSGTNGYSEIVEILSQKNRNTFNKAYTFEEPLARAIRSWLKAKNQHTNPLSALSRSMKIKSCATCSCLSIYPSDRRGYLNPHLLHKGLLHHIDLSDASLVSMPPAALGMTESAQRCSSEDYVGLKYSSSVRTHLEGLPRQPA